MFILGSILFCSISLHIISETSVGGVIFEKVTRRCHSKDPHQL